MLNHLRLPVTSEDCPKRSNINATKLIERTQIKTGQSTTVLKRKYKDYVALPTTIMYHHFWTNTTNAQKSFGDISKT